MLRTSFRYFSISQALCQTGNELIAVDEKQCWLMFLSGKNFETAIGSRIRNAGLRVVRLTRRCQNVTRISDAAITNVNVDILLPMVQGNIALTVEALYMHISNAGIREPNCGVNRIKGMIECISFSLDRIESRLAARSVYRG